MKKPMTVLKAVDQMDQHQGRLIEVEGILDVDFQKLTLWYSPSSPMSTRICSLPLITASDALSFDGQLLSRWQGEKVSVLGVMHESGTETGRPEPDTAALEAYVITLL